MDTKQTARRQMTMKIEKMTCAITNSAYYQAIGRGQSRVIIVEHETRKGALLNWAALAVKQCEGHAK
jgi:hypothetical protein